MNGPFYIHHKTNGTWLDGFGRYGELAKATAFATREGAKAFLKSHKDGNLVVATIPEVKW